MAFKLFKLPKARQFNVKPRYYDPEAEERIDRENRIRAEMGMPLLGDSHDPAQPNRAYLRGQFRKAMKHDSKTTLESRRKSNNRLLVIIAILGLLIYWLFYR